jgi:hypothetical protein
MFNIRELSESHKYKKIEEQIIFQQTTKEEHPVFLSKFDIDIHPD